MAKCRLLYQENEELGKVISSGRIAKLEGELALQKSFSDEIKKSQSGNSLLERSMILII
jgi:pre-mRNA-splicing regulator WTAP